MELPFCYTGVKKKIQFWSVASIFAATAWEGKKLIGIIKYIFDK
jgi:hypothetical protein